MFSFGPKALGAALQELQLEIPAMDEPQKKGSPRQEGRPRKVRFKISSAYSGRVLKQVYEDGQELEPPAKESSRRFLRHSFEPGEPLCGPGGLPDTDYCCWPTALTAHRISILREHPNHGLPGSVPLLSDCRPGASLCRVSGAGERLQAGWGHGDNSPALQGQWGRVPALGTTFRLDPALVTRRHHPHTAGLMLSPIWG